MGLSFSQECCFKHAEAKNDIEFVQKQITEPASSFEIEAKYELLNARKSSLGLDAITKEFDPVLEKYKQIVKDIKLNSIFDSQDCFDILNGKFELEKSLPLVNGIHDKNLKLAYHARIKEEIIQKIRYHKIYYETDMKLSPIEFIKASLTMSIEDHMKYDSALESNDVLYSYREGDTLYYFTRICTKKVMIVPGKEIIIAFAMKHVGNGKFVEVIRSYTEPDFSDKNSCYDRTEMLTGIQLYEPIIGSEDLYRVKVYQHMNPKMGVGVKVIKPFIAKYYRGFFTNLFKVVEEWLQREN